MGHYAAELGGQPFTQSEVLTPSPLTAAIARNFLMCSPGVGLRRPSDAMNVLARRHWVTDEPSRTWVEISYNRRGSYYLSSGSPLRKPSRQLIRYVHQVNHDQWKMAVRLHHIWSAATSRHPEDWSQRAPWTGQCAVTALLVQDKLGGEIVNTTAHRPDGSTESHYANRIDGRIVDYTRLQFPSGTVFDAFRPKPGGFASTRDYLLSDPSTRSRYEQLKRTYQKEALRW